ncbi:MAG: hypothetical protein ACPIOQ_18810 [Promethearchaeia archaeon]
MSFRARRHPASGCRAEFLHEQPADVMIRRSKLHHLCSCGSENLAWRERMAAQLRSTPKINLER